MTFSIGRRWLEDRGFTGFVPVRELRADGCSRVPDVPGVYALFRVSTTPPDFLPWSPAGRRRGRDPTVSLGTLRDAWVPGCAVIYLGKAGHRDRGPSLRRRLRQYLLHGDGHGSPHWGGRYVWQLADADELLVAWRGTPGEAPHDAERSLLAALEDEVGRLPFANLAR